MRETDPEFWAVTNWNLLQVMGKEGGHSAKKSMYVEEQVAFALKQAEHGYAS